MRVTTDGLRSGLAVLLVFTVVLGSVGVYVAAPPASAATTRVVDANGGTPHETIQAALDASDAGDTIEVRPGVYREAITVTKEVTLVAPNGATLNGSSFGETSTGITVNRTLGSGLTIDGFTVERYGDGIGVGASADEGRYNERDEDDVAGGWTIQNVVAQGNAEDGVDVGPAVGSAWTLRNVTAVDNGDDGIEAGGFGGTVAWRIVESNASLNREVGIYVGASSGDWQILDSTTNGNFDGLGMGVYIVSRDSDWTVGNHTASGNSFYGVDVAGSFSGAWTIHNSTLSDNSRSGLNANDVESDWVVRDTVFAGNYDWGIRAGNSPDDFRIENVTVVDNSRGGVGLTYSDGNWRIDDSRIENNGDYRGSFGIDAEYTTGVWRIDNTVIAGNVNGGINAERGSDSRPVGDATDNWWGQASGPLAGQCVGNVDCGSPLTAPPGTTASPAVVSGTVTNDSGVGLAGIGVTVSRDDGTGTFSEHATVATDASGQYRVDVDVPPGETTTRLKIAFEDPSGTYVGEWYDDAPGERTADTLDVQSGFTAFADAELADNTATVYGRVRNGSGDPLEGMLVVPYREDAGGDLRQLPGIGTDDTGQYTYEMDVPAGQSGATVKLLFADPGDVYASRYYDDAETLASATEVYVPAGERRLVSETLPREDDVTAGFSGTVTGESGAPLSDIDVTVFRDDGTGTFREWTTEATDSSGEFDIDVRPPDPNNALVRVRLRFVDPEGQYTELWYDGASESNADVAAGLVSAELGDLNATLVDDPAPAADTARVSGWVTNESGAPLDGLLVVPYATDGTGAFRQLPGVGTDANGRYAAEVDVPSGQSAVDVKLLFADPDDVYASRYYDDETTLADASAVTVPEGETRFVSEALPREDDVTAGFAGTVTNESGTALSGIDVTVFRDDGTGTFREWTTEPTDAQGRYDIDVRPADPDDRRVSVKLRFTDPTWEYAQEWNSTSYLSVRTMADAAEVSSVVGGTRYRDEVLERNVVTVAGRVRNADGESLEDMLVVPYRQEADGDFESDQSATTYTDEFGRYETEVPVRDGETTIDLKMGFFDPDDEYANTYWRNGTTFGQGEVIDADAGWELPNVRVEMPRVEDVAVRYQGTVYSGSDEALEDVLVTVFRDDGTGTYREWTNFRTDENGYWNGSVVPPAGESNVSVKIRYRDESGHYLEEWELNETSEATADTYTGTVGDFFSFYGVRLAAAPTTQVSGVVREDTWGGGALDGIRVTVYRYDGMGGFEPFATTTTDEFGYYEFQVPPQAGSSTVTTRLYFTDPTGEYASMWYRDARRYADSRRMNTPAGQGNYFNDQWLPEAGMLLDVSVQALSTCPNPADESSCTFPNDEDTVTVGPDEEVAVRYELWNGDDEPYTDYDVDDPATGTTMFGANHRIAPGDTRTTTTTLTSPLVDGSDDYRANATSVSESGRVSNSSATYTVTVEGSVVQRARVGDRFDASVSNAGSGTPVLVDGGDQGLAGTSNSTFQSTLLTTGGGDFTLNFTGNDDAPDGTEALSLSSGPALGYLTVDHSIADENVDEVVFRFRVSRASLANSGVSPGEVTLYRYVDGSPTALSTTLVRTTPTASVFEATSPGLSVFAVGAGELLSTPADSDGDGGSADTDRDRDSDDRESESSTPTPTPMPTPVSSDSDATATPEATETPASESATATGGASTAVETSEPETSVADSEGTVTTTVGADAATPTEPDTATTSTTFDGFGALTLLLALFAVLSVVLSGRRRR